MLNGSSQVKAVLPKGTDMELSERKKKILKAVIEEYVETAEPVGSKTLSQKYDLDCSSATIRNELADLSAQGYLEQPHTSAGRIPTAAGYRLYVNELMREKTVTEVEAAHIDTNLNVQSRDLDKLMGSIGRLASDMTSYPAVAIAASPATIKRFDLIYVDTNTFIVVVLLSTNIVRNKLCRLPFSFEEALLRRLSALFNTCFTNIGEDDITPQLISSTERAAGDVMGLCSVIAQFAIETLTEARSGEAVISGEANLLKQPEFRDPEKAHRVINYLTDAGNLRQIHSQPRVGDVRVVIGPENATEELKDSSVVMAFYDAGDGMQGIIGVVGPTRMDYSSVAAKLSYIAANLSRQLGSGAAMPGFDKLMIKGD